MLKFTSLNAQCKCQNTNKIQQQTNFLLQNISVKTVLTWYFINSALVSSLKINASSVFFRKQIHLSSPRILFIIITNAIEKKFSLSVNHISLSFMSGVFFCLLLNYTSNRIHLNVDVDKLYARRVHTIAFEKNTQLSTT